MIRNFYRACVLYSLKGMSTQNRIYLDHTAGKPVDPRIVAAMLPYMSSIFANPSSIHSFGQEANQALKEARVKVAELINAETTQSILFTSGATESNNLAIKGVANRNQDQGTHIITSSVEHMSVLNPCKYLMTKGFKFTFLPVDKYGVVELKELEAELTPDTILVSIMSALISSSNVLSSIFNNLCFKNLLVGLIFIL